MNRDVKLVVNGRESIVTTDENRPLLEVLREDLQLTGTKFGCGEGECGACTVLIDGHATRSCITAVSDAEGAEVQTIEGLAEDGQLHPLQQAFVDKQAMQCGYCIPGQIMAAKALLNQNPKPSRDEILDHMDGNICRCCGYPNILAAVEQAASVTS